MTQNIVRFKTNQGEFQLHPVPPKLVGVGVNEDGSLWYIDKEGQRVNNFLQLKGYDYFVGLIQDFTETDWEWIVDCKEVGRDRPLFKNYQTEEYSYSRAKDSGRSLLISLGLNENDDFIVIKINN